MKKLGVFLVAFLLMLMIPVAVFAEDSNVWTEITVSEDSAIVEVQADGTFKDGYFEIQYDTSVLSVSKEDVAFNEAIKFTSANVENNMVIVAIASEETVEEGMLFSVKFQPAKSGETLSKKDVKVQFYGEANNADGKPLKTATTADKQREVGQAVEKPVNEAAGPARGVLFAGIALIAAAAVLVIIYFVRKKVRR